MELKLSENALKVLERRYLKKDENGKVVETPEEMFLRVASAIAGAEKFYGKSEKDIQELTEAFYRIMTELEFIPNSPCLMNAGKELGQLSACFTLPIDDSMESIFETLKATSLIHKSGGGTACQTAGNIDEAAILLFDHMGQYRFRQFKRGAQFIVYLAGEIFPTHFQERLNRKRDRSVVD